VNDHAGGGLPAAGTPRESTGRRRAPLPTRVDDLPPLPPGYLRALDAGLEAIPLTLTAEARAAISAHVSLLLAWSPAINLTSIREPELVATRHVIDSLTAVPLIAARLRNHGAPLRLLDIGSGGGYPGLPIAAAVPGSEVVLLDSVAKKARFLETAASAAGLADRVAVVGERAEAIAPRVRSGAVRPFDVVTARAIGSLGDLLELSFPLLAAGGALTAWKRGDLADEARAATRAMTALGGGSIAVHEVAVAGLDGHRLVLAEKAGPTPGGFPREPARRRSQPW